MCNPGCSHSASDERRARRRRGHHDLRVADHVLRPVGDTDRHAERVPHLPRIGLRLRPIARPDDQLGEIAHELQRADLQLGLDSGADDACRADVARRQVLRRDSAGRRRPNVGQIAVVEKHRLDDSGFRVEQHHQAVQAGQPAFRIIEEAGADLDGEAVEAGHVGGLHVDLAAMRLDRHGEDRRHHDAAFGERAKGVLHDRHRVEIERDALPQLGLRQDRHARHSPPSDSTSLAGAIACWKRVMSMFFPETMIATRSPSVAARAASSAAIPMAPAPSATQPSSRKSVRIALAMSRFRHEHDLVDQVAHHSKCPSIGEADAAAKRIRPGRLLDHIDGPPGGEAGMHRRATLHADADDPRLRRRVLDRGGDPGDQPAAGERNHDAVEVGKVLEQLQPDRALPGDHIGMVEGRDLHEPARRGEPFHLRLRIVLAVSRRCALPRRARGSPRPCSAGTRPDMQIVAGMPSRLRGKGDRAAMISRRGADDAARFRLFVEAGEGIRRAADLEGPDRLDGLQLQPDIAARCGAIVSAPGRAANAARPRKSPRARRGSPLASPLQHWRCCAHHASYQAAFQRIARVSRLRLMYTTVDIPAICVRLPPGFSKSVPV